MTTIDFDTNWDAACDSAKATPIGERMTAAGYHPVRTGHGNGPNEALAWSKTLADERYVWIYDEKGGLGLDGGSRWFGELRAADGDEQDCSLGTLDELVAWAEACAAEPAHG